MKKKRILLDTSIQIGKFKYKEIKKHIEDLLKNESPISSFYVLFEFKVGLILSLINYWDYVNVASTVKLAMDRWSETQSKREPKNFILLQSLIIDHFGNISGDKKKHLRQVEFTIQYMLDNFYSGIESVLIGDFRYDEIVRYQINNRDDYNNFKEICSKKKEMIDQTIFWNKNKKALKKLIESKELEKNYPKMHEALTKINSDMRYAYMVNTNKAVGDAVIAVDNRENTKILVTDKSFEILCTILEKNFERIKNKY